MKKIIFLDIDGVICVDWDKYVDEFGHGFRKEYVGNLARIIKETGALLVISSTWRMEGLGKMKLMWEMRNLPGQVIDVTPIMNTPRGEEIAEWLRENPVDRYVILDDDSDMLPEQMNNFVHTVGTKKGGLTAIHADKAIQILNINI